MQRQSVTHQDLRNAVEAAGQRAVTEAQRVARTEIARRAFQPVDAVVVEIALDNRVKIHRYHNEDPDPAFYQLVSPAVMPEVGDRIIGGAAGGTLILWGVEPGPGYVDINAVRAGNVNDFSLVNQKFANDSQNARTIATDAVGSIEVQTDAINYPELGSEAVGDDSVKGDVIGNYEIAAETVLGSNVAPNTISAGDTVDNTFGDASMVDNGLSEASFAEDSVYGSEIATDAVGYVEINENCIDDAQVVDNGLGSGSFTDTLNNPAHNTYGLRSLFGGTSTAAAGGSHRHNDGGAGFPYNVEYTSQQRDHVFDQLDRVEAIDPDDFTGDDVRAMKGMIASLFKLATEVPGEMPARERHERMKTDPSFRHEIMMKNDPDYYARWWFEHDPYYAQRVDENHDVQHALERCPSVAARHERHDGEDVSRISDDWIEEKLAEWPYEDAHFEEADVTNRW